MDRDDEQLNRRRLSDDEIKIIVERVLEQVYSDVGKGVLKRLLWLLGAGLTALVGYLGANHIILK